MVTIRCHACVTKALAMSDAEATISPTHCRGFDHCGIAVNIL